MNQTRARHILFTALLGLFVVLLLAYNLKQTCYNCFHVMDLGIYMQSLSEMAAGNSLNPWLHVRGINAFNDHFDPIQLLAVPFLWLSNFNVKGLIVFEWLWFLALLFSIFFLYRKKVSTEKLLLYLFIPIFSKGILTGLVYPIHPTTWTFLPGFFLAYFLIERKYYKAILVSFLFCLFKESYPFAVFAFSFWFILNGKKKEFLLVFGFAIFMLVFNFKIKPMLIGPNFGHGTKMLAIFFNDPMAHFRKFDYLGLLKITYPFFIPFYFIFSREWNKSNRFSHPFIAILFFLAPLFAIQFLGGRFHHQYGGQFVGPLLPFVFLSLNHVWEDKKKLFVVFLLFVVSSLGTYTKMFKATVLGQNKYCRYDAQKYENNGVIKKYLRENMSSEENLISTGGIIPSIIVPGKRIFQFVEFSRPQNVYHYLLLEHEPNGVYPLTKEYINQVKADCRPFASQVILENENVTFYKGFFDEGCLKQQSFKR